MLSLLFSSWSTVFRLISMSPHCFFKLVNGNARVRPGQRRANPPAHRTFYASMQPKHYRDVGQCSGKAWATSGKCAGTPQLLCFYAAKALSRQHVPRHVPQPRVTVGKSSGKRTARASGPGLLALPSTPGPRGRMRLQAANVPALRATRAALNFKEPRPWRSPRCERTMAVVTNNPSQDYLRSPTPGKVVDEIAGALVRRARPSPGGCNADGRSGHLKAPPPCIQRRDGLTEHLGARRPSTAPNKIDGLTEHLGASPSMPPETLPRKTISGARLETHDGRKSLASRKRRSDT